MKTLSYSYVKYAPRVPLIILTVEKIESENFDLFFFFLFFSLMHIGVYEQSAHQTTALLPEIIFFFVKAACELRLASYSSKHMSQTLFYTPLCVYLWAQLVN